MSCEKDNFSINCLFRMTFFFLCTYKYVVNKTRTFGDICKHINIREWGHIINWIKVKKWKILVSLV